VKFGDYSPPTSPTLDQQADALHKGLGRALQWALAGCLDEEALLEACIRDQRFDQQVDDPRGAWLWQMIVAVGVRERFRAPILHALYDLADNRSTQQLCQLARHYAEAGDEASRARLYQIVEQKPVADTPWLGEEEIVALDGEQGFLFAARTRGINLLARQWEWDDDSLVDLAVERFGAEPVRVLLESSSDEAVKRFRDRWHDDRQRQAGQEQRNSPRLRTVATSVEEVMRAAEGDSKCFWLRGWGIHANEQALLMVLQHLRTVQEPQVVANLLRVVSGRRLPEFDARLIELCRHRDEGVRRRAFCALAQNTHPLIRQFALSELRKGVRDGSVAALFTKNYREGDEHRMLEAMELPDDECELHWLLMDVIRVLEKHTEADCSMLGVITYALTPCENCRFYAARLLLNQQVAPEWLNEECLHDSGRNCRGLAGTVGGSRGTG
jgi:hypothetical protein